jgi:hypothetical protein
MAAKVSWIASWVLVHSLPWSQHKRWIPIGSMGCMHTHWGMCSIEGWGSPSHVQSVVQKIREDNQKVRKTSWNVSQMPTLGLEHEKIRARWALDVSSKNMLERVWWCRHSKMESWSWTICCPMSYSNGRRHAWVEGGKKSHVVLKCCWKGNVLLIHDKVSKSKGHWSTINLAAMIEVTKAQFLK